MKNCGSIHERIRLRGRAFVHAAFSLFILNTVSGDVRGVFVSHAPFLTLILVSGWWLLARHDFERRKLLGFSGLLILAGLTLLFHLSGTTVRLLAGCLVLTGMASSFRRGEGLRVLARTIVLAAPLSCCVGLFLQAIPSALVGIHSLALAWSELIGEGLLDRPLRLGFTIQGGHVLASFLCFAAARLLVVEWRPLLFVTLCALLLAANLIFLVGHPFLPDEFRTRQGLSMAPALVFLLGVIPVGVVAGGVVAVGVVAGGVVAGVGPGKAQGGQPHSKRALPGFAMAIAIAIACTTLGLGLLSPFVVGKEAPRIGFYGANEGPLLDWDRPEFGRYGPYSQGMFGLLFEYLEADGFQCEVLEDGIESDSLQRFDALVFINVDTVWAEEELKTIWTYVRDGGNLLVLGDHSDVGGTRLAQNTLLSPVGIEFQFDGALPSPKFGWAGSDLFFHGALANVVDAWDLGIGVGASLSLTSSRALPVVNGRFGLSDVGDATAANRAFLGDYRYQAGEQLGDVILAAQAQFGRGRVLVFGDTTTFQNSVLSSGYLRNVRALFGWISGRVAFDVGNLRTGLLLVSALATLLALVKNGGSRVYPPLMVSCLLLVVTGVNKLHASALNRPPLQHATALLDLSHAPRISMGKGKNSVGGLIQNLLRNEYLVSFHRDFEEETLRRAQVFLTIAPAKTYTQAEVQMLRRFMEDGGLVMVATGYFEKAPVMPLLRPFGLDLGSAPVGPIPLYRQPGRQRDEVEFVEAWPILFREPGGAEEDSPVAPDHVPFFVHTEEDPRDDGSLPMGSRDSLPYPKLPGFRPVLPPSPLAPKSEGETRIYCRYGNAPLCVLRRVGRGALFLVGDSYFYSSKNLESAPEVSLPNILFLKKVLDDFKASGRAG